MWIYTYIYVYVFCFFFAATAHYTTIQGRRSGSTLEVLAAARYLDQEDLHWRTAHAAARYLNWWTRRCTLPGGLAAARYLDRNDAGGLAAARYLDWWRTSVCLLLFSSGAKRGQPLVSPFGRWLVLALSPVDVLGIVVQYLPQCG